MKITKQRSAAIPITIPIAHCNPKLGLWDKSCEIKKLVAG